MLCIGIDLGIKSSGFAILQNNELKEVKIVQTKEILKLINQNCIVAIDCPLTKGKGSFRKCEVELRKRKIFCFPSNSSWTKKWVNSGIKLRKELEKRGIEVIEVYPHATKKILKIGIKRYVKKNSLKERKIIQQELAKKIKNLVKFCKGKILNKDELDAILSAYTSYLYLLGKSEEIRGEGVIVIPEVY